MLRRLLFATLMATALCCLIGCGKRETTITTPDGGRATVETDRSGDDATVTFESKDGEKGTVQIEKDGDETTMTMKSEDGDTKIEMSENVDLSDLGVDVYPGATAKSNSTMKSEDMGPGEMRTVALTTPDSFKDVAKFYKDKYGDGAQAVMEQPGSLMVVREQDGQNLHISVTRDKDADETTIGITIMPKSG
jgi:hypothetical protein